MEGPSGTNSCRVPLGPLWGPPVRDGDHSFAWVATRRTGPTYSWTLPRFPLPIRSKRVQILLNECLVQSSSNCPVCLHCEHRRESERRVSLAARSPERLRLTA